MANEIDYIAVERSKHTDEVISYEVEYEGRLVAGLEKNDTARWIVSYGAFFGHSEHFPSKSAARDWIESNIDEIANTNN